VGALGELGVLPTNVRDEGDWTQAVPNVTDGYVVRGL
jgi:hypothetical protein